MSTQRTRPVDAAHPAYGADPTVEDLLRDAEAIIAERNWTLSQLCNKLGASAPVADAQECADSERWLANLARLRVRELIELGRRL